LHQTFDDVAFEIEPLIISSVSWPEHLTDSVRGRAGTRQANSRWLIGSIDHRNFRSAVAHLVAAVKRHENDNDEAEQERIAQFLFFCVENRGIGGRTFRENDVKLAQV
jgi:hypothetical protein